jgi:hypothetical protein
MNRAYYSDTIADSLGTGPNEILGELVRFSQSSVVAVEQRCVRSGSPALLL